MPCHLYAILVQYTVGLKFEFNGKNFLTCSLDTKRDEGAIKATEASKNASHFNNNRRHNGLDCVWKSIMQIDSTG